MMISSIQPEMHPEASDLLRYWREAKGGAVLPGRDALNPLRLRGWINNLSVIELHDGPREYFIRLHSEATQDRIGRNLSRTYLEDALSDDIRQVAVAPYAQARASRCPTHSLMVPMLYPGLFRKLERLVLPFTDDAAPSETSEVSRFLTWVGPTHRSKTATESVYDMIKTMPDRDLNDVVELTVLAA